MFLFALKHFRVQTLLRLEKWSAGDGVSLCGCIFHPKIQNITHLGPCSRKCLRTKTCPKTILGQILVLSRVLDHVLT
jgi:hypothetical protein